MKAMAKEICLEMSYRNGKPFAGYLYFTDKRQEGAAKTRQMAPGLVVDFAADGCPLGIEIVHPAIVTPEAVNSLLAELGQEAMDEQELAPLRQVLALAS
jgi:hypothetical protein